MQYSKPMIELVYEIRRRVPSELKPAIKMANPDMFDELIEHYHQNATTVTRALIKELAELAGGLWQDALNTPHQAATPQMTKVYRGQISLEPTKAADHPCPTAPDGATDTAKPRKMYRGRIVD